MRVIYLIIGPTSEIIFASQLKLVETRVSGMGFESTMFSSSPLWLRDSSESFSVSFESQEKVN